MTKRFTYILLAAGFYLPVCASAQADSTANREDSNLVMVQRLSINSPQSDFAPFVRGSVLYFVSGRVSQLAVQYSNENDDTEITDIYEAIVKGPTKMSGVKAVDNVNTKYHEGPLVVSRGGNHMFLTSSDKKTKRLKLYTSDRISGEWSKPALLSFCRDSFSYCHPALSASEDTLFFSTNCCGQGKMDICYTIRKGQDWGEVKTFDDKLNSSSNELFPFAGPEGRLYFTSDRPGGLGGLDIYRYNLTDRSQSPYLLDPPINSAADDFGIWTDSTAQSGYFSSNRKPRNGDDIFYFGRSIPDFSDSEPVPVPESFCYEFEEENSPEVSDSVSFVYHWNFGDGETANGIRTEHCYKKPGVYNVELNVIQNSLGYLDTTLVAYQIDVPEPQQLRIHAPDTVRAFDEVKLDSDGSKLKGYEIKKRYWSYGDGFFSQGAQTKHVYKKEGKYTVQLWVMCSRIEDQRTRKFKLTKEIVVEKAR